MADETGDADPWIEALRAGEAEAVFRFVERYRPALERVAARNIDERLRRRFGPESVAQSVCRTFLRRAKEGRLELADADRLWALLCAIALTKVREKARFHLRQKRSVEREVAADAAAERVPAAQPPPDEQVAVAEAFDQFLAGCDDEERRVLGLRLDGAEVKDIADEIGTSRRTVFRILARIEDRLRRDIG